MPLAIEALLAINQAAASQMKFFALLLVLSFGVLASGCAQRGTVKIVVGEDHKVKSVAVVKSTGDPKADARMVKHVRSRLPGILANAPKGKTYIQPVKLRDRKNGRLF